MAHRPTLMAASLIVLATLLAYSNSFSGPFILDDEFAIVDNPTIRNLFAIGQVLTPPNQGETVTGRPILNVSFAVNYALNGTDVFGYHLANLLIHLANSLLLFVILHRTFLLPSMRNRWNETGPWLAFGIAMLWAVHPLQTESVTYIVQRAESLVALFYLLTLYCALRGVSAAESTAAVESPALDNAQNAKAQANNAKIATQLRNHSIAWYAAAVFACLLGMASKEVMVSAPVLVLLYDRTFLAGTFREAWRRRYGLYLALACTWALLTWLVIETHGRGGSAGFGATLSSWEYLCTQFGAVVHYLRLCFCPYSLVFDYGVPVARGAWAIAPYAILVGCLGLATLVALWRWPKVGFLDAWFFAILAPTSSFVPVVTQTIAEHRMYLPLAAVMAGIVLGCFVLGENFARRGWISIRALKIRGGWWFTCVIVIFIAMTLHRNSDYRSAESIWRVTVNQMPHSARAHNNLGMALARCGQWDQAIEQYRLALDTVLPHENPSLIFNNYGTALIACGRVEEAIAQYETALDLKPKYALAHYNYGNALASQSKYDEAATHYKKALEIQPDYPEAYNNLGNVLLDSRRAGEAIAAYENALTIKPAYAEAHCNLAAALTDVGRLDEAIEHCQKALQLRPQYPKAGGNLQTATLRRQEIQQALTRQRELLRQHPNDAKILNETAWILATNPNASIRNGTEAVSLARQAVQRTESRNPALLKTLAAAYAESGQFSEAVQTVRQALELSTQQNLATEAEQLRSQLLLYEKGLPYREAVGER